MTRWDTDALKAAYPVERYCQTSGIELRKSGAEMRGTCPFCNVSSRAPFAVSGRHWRCNACNAGGDVVRLVKMIEGLDDGAAMARVAELGGVERGRELSPRKRIAAELKAAAKQMDREEAAEGAAGYWARCARQDEQGRAYLRSRGVEAAHGEVRYRNNAIAIPLHDRDGAVINVVRRMINLTSPDAPKTPGLRNCSTAGSFGRVSDAELTTGPVVLVEGVFDYLSARALLPAHLVLGCSGAGRWPDLVEMVMAVAKVRGLVLVPHLTDMNRIGAKKVQQAIKAARRGGVQVIRRFDLASGDLNDYLMAGGHGQALLDAPALESVALDFEETDLGNSRLLAHLHSEDLRFLPETGQWLRWDGKRWVEASEDVDLVRAAAAAIEKLDGEHRQRSQSRKSISAMITLARAAPDLTAELADLDADNFLLSVANGTLDLRTGELSPHRREDLITVGSPCAYDPDATAPRWDRFLDEVFEPHPDAKVFLQRFAGYSLTGDTSAQCLLFAHGSGANGKGALFRVMHSILGPLSGTLPFDLFVDKDHKRITPEYLLASVSRARAVFVSESRKNERIDNAVINSFTGEDKVEARHARGRPFSYRPRAKLWMTSNHLPHIDADDYALWRRFRIVPFAVRFEGAQRDPHLDRKLAAELPGILAWAVRGALAWQADGGGIIGLGDSQSVAEATEGHRVEGDAVGQFLAECCVLPDEVPGVQSRVSALYEEYRKWSEERGTRALSLPALSAALKSRGLDRFIGTGNRRWFPIGLQR